MYIHKIKNKYITIIQQNNKLNNIFLCNIILLTVQCNIVSIHKFELRGKKMNIKKVVVGLSGGVDSSVCAYLLKKEGYDVYGVTVLNFDGGKEAAEEAKKIAEQIGINHIVLDFRDEFKCKIKDAFVNDYLSGRTPNPCVICNRTIKWDALMKIKKEINADYVATGHYAKVVEYPKTNRVAVKMSNDITKDQTYVLSFLTQEQIKSTLFPLGEYTKDEVRGIARQIGLSVADKKDSQEICFIPDKDYAAFIESYTGKKSKPGQYVDANGNKLGMHKGIIHYTIGQRKGLGVSFGKHMFVNRIIADKNQVVLGSNEDLFKNEVFAKNVNYMAMGGFDTPFKAEAKIRYAHKKAPCTIYPVENGILKCVFDEPQRAAAPGQTLVVYDGEYCLMAGIIE